MQDDYVYLQKGYVYDYVYMQVIYVSMQDDF